MVHVRVFSALLLFAGRVDQKVESMAVEIPIDKSQKLLLVQHQQLLYCLAKRLKEPPAFCAVDDLLGPEPLC